MAQRDGYTFDVPLGQDDRLVRLLAFAEDVLDTCASVCLSPVLDGSLAVLAYSRSPELVVGDVDFSLDRAHFSVLADALTRNGIFCEIQPWLVLQARRDDLKVEFGDTETWSQGMSEPFEQVRLGDHIVRMINRGDLRISYERGANALAAAPEELDKYTKIANRLRLLENDSSIP